MARDNPRCLPPTRTLRRIRWPLQPRSRDRPTTFGDVTTTERRSHVILGLARSRTVSLRLAAETPGILSIDATSDVLPPDAAPPRPPFTRTATLFGALRACLFEARMLPADFCNCLRRTDERSGALVSSQGRWPWPPSFSYASRTTFSCEKRWHAASRAFVRVIMTPVPVPPGYPGLPDRDISTTATPPPPCGVGVQCRLTCTGLWTERRTCPRSWLTLVRRDREECVRLAHADDVPLLILPEDIPLSSVRPFAWERAPHNRTGPTKAHVLPPTREGWRHPANRDAFHRCSRGTCEGLLLLVTRAGLSLTPPTRCPHGWGQCAFTGIASLAARDEPRVRITPACAGVTREQVTFCTR